MDEFLPYINFGKMKIHFLLDVIPHVAQQFEENIRDQIMKKYEKALERKYGGDRRMARLEQTSEVNRHLVNDANNVAFKCDFNNIYHIGAAHNPFLQMDTNSVC